MNLPEDPSEVPSIDDDEDQLMKLSEVAKILNMTPEYVRRNLITPNGGRIPAVRVGRHWRVKRSDLKDFIEKRYYISGTRPASA